MQIHQQCIFTSLDIFWQNTHTQNVLYRVLLEPPSTAPILPFESKTMEVYLSVRGMTNECKELSIVLITWSADVAHRQADRQHSKEIISVGQTALYDSRNGARAHDLPRPLRTRR